MPKEKQWIATNHAIKAIVILALLQIISLALFFQFKPIAITGLATGQVLSEVQNELPLNYYFNADAATEVFDGKPAFRLSIGGDMVMDGKERDLNGYSALSGSTCSWVATGFSSTTAISFNTCNATDCNYTCTLTISSSTPSGTYNVTSTILDSSGSSSILSQLIHLFDFNVPSPSPNAGGEGSSGSGRDILILRPKPSVTPTPIISPSPTPPVQVSPGAGSNEFKVSIAASDFINKCEIKEVEVIVENNNPVRKKVTLQFEGKTNEMELQPYEVRSAFFEIKAPKATGETTYSMAAVLYQNGIPILLKEKQVRLLWPGLDTCPIHVANKQFVFVAGKESIALVDLEMATDVRNPTFEVEVTKNNGIVFLDLYDSPDGYYKTSFNVFEKGTYDFKVLVRKGFDIVQQKLEKVQIG